MKQQGRDYNYIVKHTIYEDAAQVATAVRAYRLSMTSVVTEKQREEHLAEELARIDAVMANAWEIMDADSWKYNKDGDALEPDYKDRLAAHKTILQCVKMRAELTGLTVVDPSHNATNVYLISGTEADYIKGLQATLE